jgi:leader peptidase (prepilin peptidase)/N-methyltransferase
VNVLALAGAGALLGAIVGSFLGAMLLRWPEGRSVARGRSVCDGCGRTLGPAELVPLLSYLLLRGRCRSCGSRIDPRQPMMEAAAAGIGALALGLHGLPLGAGTALLGWGLLILAALDAEHHWLPDLLTLPLALAGLAAGALALGPPLGDRAIGAAAGFLVLAGIALLYRALRGREGLGGGDPKLFGAIGAWLGWTMLPFVLLGAGLAGLASLALKRARGERIAADDRLPLGTLMALAAWPLWLVAAGRGA